MLFFFRSWDLEVRKQRKMDPWEWVMRWWARGKTNNVWFFSYVEFSLRQGLTVLP